MGQGQHGSCRWNTVVPALDQDRRTRRTRPTVDVDGASVVKRYEPADFDAELVKAGLLHEASLTADFVAPAVLAADETQRTIRYQRLDCRYDLLDVVADPGRSPAAIVSTLRRVGACLAAIHELRPPTDRTCTGQRSPLFTAALDRRSEASEPGDRLVLQHGDFGFTNVFVGPDDEITIIDPSPNGYTSIHPLNVDCAELDLAILCSHLVGRVADRRALARIARSGRSMVDAVVGGYGSLGGTIDRPRLRTYTLASIDAVAAHRSPGSRWHRRAALRPLSTLLARNLT